MKIAYISPYRDGTGYSYAAIGNILAADAAGIAVVPRPVTMTPPRPMTIPARVSELEKGSVTGVQAAIQHNLPHTYERRSDVLNVGAFAWETTHFNFSKWPSSCNLMDQCWVFCQQSRQAALDSGVRVPVFVVPHACDLNRYAKKPAPIPNRGFSDKCVFYTIGENTRRKNFPGLLRAYYNAFTSRSQVLLVVKTNFPGCSDSQALDQAKRLVADMKAGTHIHRDPSLYPPVIILPRRWSEDQIDALHATGHVFVTTSRGESWCVPAMDAMGFGNPVIASNWGSFPDLLDPDSAQHLDPQLQLFPHRPEVGTGWLVPGQLTPCFGQEGLPDLYTGGESWFDTDLRYFARAMQEAYRMWCDGSLAAKGGAAAERVREFSYDKVGEIIRSHLAKGGVV